MAKELRNLVIVLFSIVSNFSHAGYSGVWADDCDNGKSYFILSRNHDSGPYQVILCAGFSCIPMPGMKKPTTLFDDPVFKIISEQKLELKGKTYLKCNEFQEAHFAPIKREDIDKYLIGDWVQVAQMSKGIEEPIKDDYYKNSVWNVTDVSIASSRDEKESWRRDYKLIDELIAIYHEGKVWRHYKILGVNNERLYLSELERPSEAIRVFMRKQ
ncbi:hypothetical protein [Teredinibacter sp. KSP-S5-2]|uniref:hypothetical protein n=1 Tax=Teredinibacter sp. KSP-S5-2 TaxID=3034506 RepID=UPI0029344813|nr:hypothetical protein [Teredinibacter sp. KSP-S5-2]WNO11284.1 hypothetical protein P5V12_08880 [Teredinibacter sp. KSP-S5-2]